MCCKHLIKDEYFCFGAAVRAVRSARNTVGTSCEVGGEESLCTKNHAHTHAGNATDKKPFVCQCASHFQALVTDEVAIRSERLLRTEGKLVCDSGHA